MVLDNYSTHKHPRYRLHFTSTSASWLNQVETWLSIFIRRQIRRGVFKSVKDLVDAIEKYIAAHNQSPAPFVWTKTTQQILAKATCCKDLTLRDTRWQRC